jgi:hypothetical protein
MEGGPKSAMPEVGFSFDQFVGDLLEKRRHLKAQRLGGLKIYRRRR